MRGNSRKRKRREARGTIGGLTVGRAGVTIGGGGGGIIIGGVGETVGAFER